MLLVVLPGDISRGDSRPGGGERVVGEGGTGATRLERISRTVVSTEVASDEAFKEETAVSSHVVELEACFFFNGGAMYCLMVES